MIRTKAKVFMSIASVDLNIACKEEFMHISSGNEKNEIVTDRKEINYLCLKRFFSNFISTSIYN